MIVCHPRCGSCQWSKMPYEEQLTNKLQGINEALSKAELPNECLEIVPSPKITHYRNRMDFTIDFRGRAGLRERERWDHVLDNHHCIIGDPEIERLFAIVRAWVQSAGLSYHDRKRHQGLLRTATIRVTQAGQSMITILTAPAVSTAEQDNLIAQLKKLADLSQVTTLVWGVVADRYDQTVADKLQIITGPGYIEEEINPYRFRISPNAFFQNNSAAAGYLLQTVQEFAGDTEGQTLLDLYCGSGFFAIGLAFQAARTIGIETIPEAIEDAKHNAELNGVKIEWHASATEAHNWVKYEPDTVILDPPRAGLQPAVINQIKQAQPNTIVYVSCKYERFVQEIKQLEPWYRIERLRAIDMFPQTPHVELVARLVKK